MKFTRASNLTRHKKKCADIKLKIHFEEYQNQLKFQELEMKIGYLEKNNKELSSQNNELKQLIKSGSVGNTYNISIKNYIQQNYPDAPPLESFNDYDKLEYDNDDFIDTLVYNFNNNYLHKYLGDFIIKYYKKDDPTQQSMWSSDTSRLTYIIKELLSNKKSIWNHDYKGVKTKNYIINPLLKYIKNYINEYWIKNLDNFKTLNIDDINKFHSIYQNLYKIKKMIDNDILGMDIIRYITPHFYMNKNDPQINLIEQPIQNMLNIK
jgi:hypothetical protein